MYEGFQLPFAKKLLKFLGAINRGARSLLKSPPSKSAEADSTYEHQKALHAAYVAQRAEANKFALEIAGRYERMLSLIAGGSLAVSLTFIEKIAPSPVPYSRWFALASWGFLTFAIIASLYAISQSQNAVQKQMDILDIEIGQALYPEDERFKGQDTNNLFTQKVTRANVVSLSATIIGLIALIAFAFINFSTSNQYESKKTNTTDKTTKCSCSGIQEGKLPTSDESSSPSSASSKTRKIDDESKTETAHQTSSTNEGVQGVLHSTAEPSSTPTPSVSKESKKIEGELKTKTTFPATSTSEGAQGELQTTAKSSPTTSSSQTGTSSEKVR